MKNAIVKFKMEQNCDDLIPAKAHPDDAAYDLRSRVETILQPGIQQLVPTGLFLELPLHYEAQIRPRSGMAIKYAITCLNTPGTIDAGYRGEVQVVLFNAGKESYPIKRGDRIAQMVITQLPEIEMIQVSDLTESARGAKGFGSSGKN